MNSYLSLCVKPDGRILNHVSKGFNAIATFALGATIFDATLAILSPLNHGFSPTRDLIIAFAAVIIFRKIGKKLSALAELKREDFLKRELERHLKIQN